MRLRVNSVGDSGRLRGPVGIFLKLQVQVHVPRPGGPAPLAEQPGQEGRGPAVIGQLEKHQQNQATPGIKCQAAVFAEMFY